ncbi:MAG: 1-acyl-sn-glycerol-3-phosphate acyltransferase [Coriobacteriia bacterium]|nr:1-acyl-sn-glycerol-3-phosphate acyltransferase [Coriobacteriia bacterium]
MKPLDYFFDTPASGEGHFPQRFCAFFCGLIKLAFKLLFRYKSADLEVMQGIAPGEGAILAPNHRSYLDPLYILAELRPRPIRFMGKIEFFQIHPAISRMAAWVGVYPVKRHTADMGAIKRSVRMLRRGELVGIFPEGTRIRKADQEVTYHEGVAMIAAMADVPVVPIRIWGTERICPEGTSFFRTPKVSLRFGQPLRISDEPYRSLPKDQRNAAFTAAVMQAIYDLEPLAGTPEGRDLEARAYESAEGGSR